MARSLTWSPSARDDVREIAAFIKRSSVRYAAVVVQSIFEAVERLSSMPTMGSIVPEADRDDLRQLHVYSYPVIVRVAESGIEVIAILHGARDVRRLLTERL